MRSAPPSSSSLVVVARRPSQTRPDPHLPRSNKYIAHERSDGGISHLHFHWQPLANPDHLRTFLSQLDSPASHIFFNVGLWLTREDPDAESYAARMKPLLDALVDAAPQAKIVARTMAGAVQAVVRPPLAFLSLSLSLFQLQLTVCYSYRHASTFGASRGGSSSPPTPPTSGALPLSLSRALGQLSFPP